MSWFPLMTTAGTPWSLHLRQSALHNAERAIVRCRVVENVAEPYQQVGLLRQGKLYGGLERPLEVPFPLVDPTFDRVREVRAPEVGIANRSYLHRAQSLIVPSPSSCGELHGDQTSINAHSFILPSTAWPTDENVLSSTWYALARAQSR